ARQLGAQSSRPRPRRLAGPGRERDRPHHPGHQGRGGHGELRPPGRATMAGMLEVSVWRGGEKGRYQIYQVPLRANQTVLDVVTFVQRHLDPTLAYRFACRVGMCGSCAMTVNGRPPWTC